VDSVIDNQTATMRMRAVFPNPDSTLLPGMFARVKLPVYSVENALVIPDTTLLPEKNGKYHVFIFKSGKALKQSVGKGLESGSFVQIKKGLSAEDVVITAGNDKLKDGSSVKVQKKTEGNPSRKNGKLKNVILLISVVVLTAAK